MQRLLDDLIFIGIQTVHAEHIEVKIVIILIILSRLNIYVCLEYIIMH